MAFSPLRSKALHHGRSLSLPSTSNTLTSKFEENLKSSKSTSSLSSFNIRINGLKNLYSNLDGSILTPHNQHIISNEAREKWVDKVLDGHIKLLDSCNAAKDIFSHIKNGVQDLLSALRRKDANGVKCYLASRKNSRKMIQKSLKDLKSLRSKHAQSLENEIVCLFKDAESSTFDMLESLFSYVIGTKSQTRQNGWSVVSKLIQSKKVSQVEEIALNEFMKVDALLMSQEDNTQVQEIVNHLKEIETNIQVLEEELECLFRQFINIRVSLLNSLNF